MASAALPHVVRFPMACPRCAATTAMPLTGGTLSQRRTQLNLKCHDCRHEWPIELAPPVLIVRPDRQTDGDTSRRQPPIAEERRPDDRRNARAPSRQRMHAGLCGVLRSSDRTQTLAVLYSLDARRVTGRVRPLDPASAFPRWLVPGSRLWLSAYDGAPIRIRISVVRPRRDRGEDDEHYAEFTVSKVTRSAEGSVPMSPE